jgi:hypothetical protein
MMRKNVYEQLADFYGDNIPGYILDAGKTFITILEGADWMGGPTVKKITLADVVKHYTADARNLTSGCRSLGPVVCDWRGVSNLAQECLLWFKFINLDTLRRETRRAGLIPKSQGGRL